jgi:hypothetical protein
MICGLDKKIIYVTALPQLEDSLLIYTWVCNIRGLHSGDGSCLELLRYEVVQ